MYPEEDRRIFTYEHRGEKVAVDPAVIERGLKAAIPDDEDFRDLLSSAFRNLEEIEESGREAYYWKSVDPAQSRLADAVRSAFGLTAVRPDGSGMPEAEAIGLMDRYLGWKYDVKKGTATSPDGSPTTEPSPAP